jgi:hypothetical protein
MSLATCNECLARDLEINFGTFDDPRELPRILSRHIGSELRFDAYRFLPNNGRTLSEPLHGEAVRGVG